jgi:DNA-binding SARP family transcriptional activator
MEYRIFGNLEVVSRGRVIKLGGNRLRAFTATMLIHGREPVSIGQFSSYIWDEPPNSAAANIRTYATELRRLLDLAESGAGQMLRTVSGGAYQLLFEKTKLDAYLFDSLLAESETHFGRGDLTRAITGLDEALRLWRGRPLQNVHGSWLLATQVATLEERYLMAAERRASIFLAASRYRESVVYLQRLVSEFPLNERLWEMFIKALANSGRRADALLAYERAREQLVNVTGLEPSAELRSLRLAILKEEPV